MGPVLLGVGPVAPPLVRRSRPASSTVGPVAHVILGGHRLRAFRVGPRPGGYNYFNHSLIMPRAMTKRSTEDRRELRDAALLLRYRTATPGPGAPRYLGYKPIAKVLRLSVNQVQHLCTYTAVAGAEEDKVAAAAATLGPDQLAEITAEGTLVQMAGYSLAERVRLIERRYPGKTITAARLRGHYQARGIKRKFVRQ